MALIAIGWLLAQFVVILAYALWLMFHSGAKFPDPHQLGNQLENSGLVLSISTMTSAPVGIGLAVLFARLRKSLPLRDYFSLHWPGAKVAALWTASFIVFMTLGDVVTHFLGRPLVPEVMVNLFRNAGIAPLLWLAVVVAGPLAEECVFRGFFFTGLQYSRLGATGAIVCTSASWAVVHLQYDFYGMFLVFLTGIFLGIARSKTNSLPLCFLLHAVMNLFALLETVYLLR
jgi:hypothetical protein